MIGRRRGLADSRLYPMSARPALLAERFDVAHTIQIELLGTPDPELAF